MVFEKISKLWHLHHHGEEDICHLYKGMEKHAFSDVEHSLALIKIIL